MTEENKELTGNDNKELTSQKEFTVPCDRYVPVTDIVDSGAEVKLYMDMPGVNKEGLNIKLEKNSVEIDGRIDSKLYAGLRPFYSEYGLGRYIRKFQLSSDIDQSKIGAEIENGVLILNLPKVAERQPRLIAVS